MLNQVLTKKTAFICVVKENNKDEIDGLKKVKEIVPQVQSIDYCRKNDESKNNEVNYQGKGAPMMNARMLVSYSVADGTFSSGEKLLSAKKPRSKETLMKKDQKKKMKSQAEDEEDDEDEHVAIVHKANAFSAKEASKIDKTIIPLTGANDKDLLEIIQKQKLHGYWELTSDLLEKIGIKKEVL